MLGRLEGCWCTSGGVRQQVATPLLRLHVEESLPGRPSHPQVLLRARPTVSADDLASYEKFTSEFGEEG